MQAPYYEVECQKHGKPLNDNDRKMNHKRVKVGTPKNKRERLNSGCPQCHREQIEASAVVA